MNNSVLDLNLRHAGIVNLGSIEGSGQINLRNNSLSVGSNNLSTVFSGTILGHSPGGGISKSGSGTFTLTGDNQYGGHLGGTSVAGGVLLISNTIGSGSGKGVVGVSNATLGGSGAIAGNVVVGQFASGVLAPSEGGTTPVTLVIRKTLSFFSRSTYKVALDSHMHAIDAVVANGISINGARFSVTDLSSDVLPIGAVFTVIQNSSADAIAGTFANLPDGSTLTVGSNTFQVSYQGGDGNDLTLTVVPRSCNGARTL
jgi:autotransporter-associated beta strand protein